MDTWPKASTVGRVSNSLGQHMHVLLHTYSMMSKDLGSHCQVLQVFSLCHVCTLRPGNSCLQRRFVKRKLCRERGENEEAAPQTYKIQTSYIRLRRQAGLSKLVSQRQSLVGYLFVVITGTKGSDFVCARSQ